MCFRMPTPDSRALRRNCRIDLAARSSRLPRPPRHDQKRRAAEAPRSRRLNDLAADLTDKRLASLRPRSSNRAYSSGWEIGVTPEPHLELFAVHLHDEFDRIVERYPWRKHSAAGLQIAPLQRTVSAVEDENHAPLGSFDPYLHEALEEGRMVEIEQAGQGLDMERPGAEPLDPVPERLLPDRHLRVHLGAQAAGARIERPVADGGLFWEVQRRADAEVGPAAAIDEVVHHSRGAVAVDFLPVILEVMRIPGHRDSDVVARQEVIERSEICR